MDPSPWGQQELGIVKWYWKPGLVTHSCNTSTQEAETVGLPQVQGQYTTKWVQVRYYLKKSEQKDGTGNVGGTLLLILKL